MKKNIAIVWGGYTSEIVVSEKSMKGIYSFIDKLQYNIYSVKVVKDSWTVELDGNIVDVDKNDFSFTFENRSVKFDFAYITIHGAPGEDGALQGYLDMLGVPYSSCGVLAASLTMNKYICNRYLSTFGFKTAKSIVLKSGEQYNIDAISEEIGFPMFIKPNLGGSSFATTKVKEKSQIQKAIDLSFGETCEIIIESFINGKEITCGCYETNQKMVTLPLTEVVTSNEFFDYNAKYNGEVEEITPARISDELTQIIQNQTAQIYKYISAKGIIRVDYIIQNGIPFLLEVNTTPGMTLTSFIPQQIKAANLNITDVFSDIIENECNKCR